jgi:hypothetical protein
MPAAEAPVPANEPSELTPWSATAAPVGSRRVGTRTTKVPPGPGSTETLPPWASTIAFTMARPRPTPPEARALDGSAR